MKALRVLCTFVILGLTGVLLSAFIFSPCLHLGDQNKFGVMGVFDLGVEIYAAYVVIAGVVFAISSAHRFDRAPFPRILTRTGALAFVYGAACMWIDNALGGALLAAGDTSGRVPIAIMLGEVFLVPVALGWAATRKKGMNSWLW
jgi:heme/copper-type cytochrome/quinol oxidase subunit 1